MPVVAEIAMSRHPGTAEAAFSHPLAVKVRKHFLLFRVERCVQRREHRLLRVKLGEAVLQPVLLAGHPIDGRCSFGAVALSTGNALGLAIHGLFLADVLPSVELGLLGV